VSVAPSVSTLLARQAGAPPFDIPRSVDGSPGWTLDEMNERVVLIRWCSVGDGESADVDLAQWLHACYSLLRLAGYTVSRRADHGGPYLRVSVPGRRVPVH